MAYTQAPLPFTGQKRRFLTHFKSLLNQHLDGDGTGWTIIDAFGGSGLLAHTAKRCKPAARVIYNDFDGYAERLAHIPDTNRLRQILADLLQHQPRQKRLPDAVKKAAEAAINGFGGYLDLDCLAAWLLFSGKTARDLPDLYSHQFYHCVRQHDYPDATDYLDGLEIVSQPYHELLPPHLDDPKTLLVLDPPYVCTQQGSYRKAGYFGMVQFLRLMRLVRPPFVFFSSTRSELLEYLDLVIGDKMEGWDRFKDYQKISLTTHINQQAVYEDNLVYRF
ncbi:hypothetical protein [Conchiformibius steedae]|uniref:hypothetical protein n=1 Tax=Conchiformibius steedae TaxID=153493 RepID=UPI0026F180B5|nr:hypothetical protein [Conchiformibius steedae]